MAVKTSLDASDSKQEFPTGSGDTFPKRRLSVKEDEQEEVKSEALSDLTDSIRRMSVASRYGGKATASGRLSVLERIPGEGSKEIRSKASVGELSDSEATFRYTPILVRDPRQFVSQGYTLRTSPNVVKIFIVVTMYNEAYEEVITTLRGICENVRNFCIKTGDPTFWKQIAVCIVSDGREKANQQTLDYLRDLGIYDENLVAETVKEHGPSGIGCHLFESMLVFNDSEIGEEFPPLQTMFALKEHNGGKIDSHHWFFKAFSDYLKPKYNILLDVGTKPRRKALYHLFRAMERNSKIAGCCGEITTRQKVNTNFLVSTQHLEYKMAAMFDKVLESVTGYMSVLPGAFSAYRYEAICGAPLDKYFHHVEHPNVVSPWEANMYLAEDRLLCFEMFSKANNQYVLHFVSDAVAETDVPTTIVDLLKQRRRWMNGTLFSMMHEFSEFMYIWTRGEQSIIRKIAVSLIFIYYLLSMAAATFMVSMFYIIVDVALRFLFANQDPLIHWSLMTFLNILFASQFLFGLGHKIKYMERHYNVLYMILGIYFIILYVAVFQYSFILVQRGDLGTALGLVAFFFFLFVSLMSQMFISVCACILQYIFATPLFMVILPIYAFCNVHDASWGTKGAETGAIPDRPDDGNYAQALKEEAERKKKAAAEKENMEAVFLGFRIKVLMIWALLNLLFTSCVLGLGLSLLFMRCAVFGILGTFVVKFTCLIIYRITFNFNRTLERYQNASLAKEDIKTRRSFLASLVDILALPVSPLTWLGFLIITLVSPVMTSLQAAFVLGSSFIVMPLSFFPSCNQFTRNLLISWRSLAKLDFSLFSNDGWVAKALKVDSATKKHTVRSVPDAHFSCRNDVALLDDPANWRPFLYFVVAKPIFVIIALAAIFSAAWFPVTFIAGDWLLANCDGTESVLCSYVSLVYDNQFWSSYLKPWYGEYLIGYMLLWVFFFVPKSLFGNLRSLVSNLLGDPSVPLDIKRNAAARDALEEDVSDEYFGRRSSELRGRALSRAEIRTIRSKIVDVEFSKSKAPIPEMDDLGAGVPSPVKEGDFVVLPVAKSPLKDGLRMRSPPKEPVEIM